MLKKIFTLLTFLSIATFFAKAQQTTDKWQESTIDFLESSFSENESLDIQQLIEDLQQFADNPININTCNFDELKQLGLLNPIEIQNLIAYRERYGKILSPFELIAIDGYSPQLIKLIQPFIYFGELNTISSKQYASQEILMRATHLLEKQKGFKEPRKYEGSPLKLYTRYKYSTSNIHIGLTAEKDAGESFLKSSNPHGFDFYSGYANYTSSNNQVQLYAGDYRLQFGQGLSAWQGFSIGKSSEATQGAKFNQGIKPYTSTDENLFMRGIAAKINTGNFKFFPFFSFKKFDANTDSIDQRAIFTSFQTSGLHRTKSEIEDKNSVKELSLGSYITFTKKNYTLGFTALNTFFNIPLDRRNADYNKYLFEGDQISNFSLDYQFGLDRYYLFGEVAACSTHGMAAISGILAKPIDQIETTAIYRNIGKKFNSPFAMAFTETSKINDEQGLYVGMKILPAPKVSLNFYVDFFKHRWIKYTTVAPSKGSEYFMQVNYQLSKNWDLYARYFFEKKPIKATVNSEKINLDQKRQKMRLHLSGNLSRQFSLRSRLELSDYLHDHHSKGFIIYQDFGFEPKIIESKLWFRIAYFNTDDYDSRIYCYENDLLYQFSIPAFYNKGMRFYFNAKVKICEKTDLWIKASRTCIVDAESIGSGYGQIDGNKRTELKVQLRHRF